MQLVFASNNKNKIKEIQALIPNTIKIISLEDIGCIEDIPETAETIERNKEHLRIMMTKEWFSSSLTEEQRNIINNLI